MSPIDGNETECDVFVVDTLQPSDEQPLQPPDDGFSNARIFIMVYTTTIKIAIIRVT